MQEPDPVRYTRIEFEDASPYPKITASEPNSCFARMLLDDYAGTVSEMTSVSQYLYHSHMTEDDRVNTILQGILAVEMRHMSILAKLIRSLGGDPLMRNGSGIWWNPKAVYYGSGLADRIRADIDTERKAICCYELHCELIEDPAVIDVLRRIILDEDLHIRLLQDISREYGIP